MAKKEKVQEMFNGIAPKYDLLNHLLSMGVDKSWRKKAMKVVGAIPLNISCTFSFLAMTLSFIFQRRK